MRHNKSSLNIKTQALPNNSLNIKSLLSPSNKKVQGFDRTTSSQAFASKVSELKNKPKKQTLEDQYIGGLQDEIKYLEMELKLLQEKDQDRHGHIDQLQKFFGDGIPINQNILAIKNGFNNYRNNNEKKIKDMAEQRQERSTLINGLAVRVQTLLTETNQKQKDNRSCAEKSQLKWYELIFQEASLKRSLQKQQDDLKSVKQDNRKLFEQIQKVTRNKLIENITIIKHENNKHTKLNQLKQTVREREEQLLELQKQYTQLLKEEEQKSYLMKLQEQILSQRKKIIGFERDHDNLRSKIKEKQVQLQQKLKERMVQINSKLDIKGRVDGLKEEINKQNSITVEYVTEMAREKEIERMNQIVDNNKKLAKYTDHYTTVLSGLENSIQTLAQRKPQVRSQIQAYTLQLTKLAARQLSENARQVHLQADMTQLQQMFNESKAKITPLQERTRKSTEQTQAYLEERRRLLQEIRVKEKQLELIFVLKGLNFDEAEISKSSNSNIQQELTSFMKNWQKIQRNA